MLVRRRGLLIGAGAVFSLSALPAWLREALAEQFRTFPVTLTTTSQQVLPATGTNRRRLVFINPSKTANIAYCPATRGDVSAVLPAVVNGAGSITLTPLTWYQHEGSTGFNVLDINVAFNGISDTNPSPLTILEYTG